jgi:cytochrome c2
VIIAHLVGSTQAVSVQAVDEGKTGHYVAVMTLPQTGDWEWAIDAFGGTQPMPALTVVKATTTVAQNTPVASDSNPLPLLAGGVGLLGTLGGLLALQKKIRWAAAIVLIGLLVSGVGFASASIHPKAETKSETQVDAPVSSISQADLGRNLFIAKGCMLCHSHNETNKVREFGVDIGPDLTNITASAEYLHLWLKDPSAVKSTAKMPNLGLSDTEIDALIAFINDK